MYNKLYWTQIQLIQYGVLVFHSGNFHHISSKAHTFEPVFVHKKYTHITLYIRWIWTDVNINTLDGFFFCFLFFCSRLSAFSLYVLLLPLIFLFHLFYTNMHSNRYQITFSSDPWPMCSHLKFDLSCFFTVSVKI